LDMEELLAKRVMFEIGPGYGGFSSITVA